MKNIENCLTYFVGLSSKSCNCTILDRPAQYADSSSGYFLDDMVHGIKLQWANSVADCGDNGLWGILAKAREEGIKQFLEAFTQEVANNKKEHYTSYRGIVGNPKQSSYLMSVNNSTPFVGVEIRPAKRVGAEFRLRELSICTNSSSPITVEIYSSQNFVTPIFSHITTGAVGARRYVAVNEDLPLNDAFGNAITYYVVYERVNGLLCYDNQFSCGCGGENKDWQNWVSGGGFQVQGLADLEQRVNSDTLNATDNATYSILLNGTLTCNVHDIFCKLDPAEEGYAKVVAKCIQLFSINALLTYIGKSDRVNYYTLMNAEIMAGQYKSNLNEIKKRMLYLVQNIPSELTDCYICGDANTMRKTSILV